MKEKKEVYFIEDDKIKKWTIETREVLVYRWDSKQISYNKNKEEQTKWLIKKLGWKLSEEKAELRNLRKRQETAEIKQEKVVDDLINKINNIKIQHIWI